MNYTDVFERYEIKYILTEDQRALLMQAMDSHMRADNYGQTTIRNVYYDTPDLRLIRNSLDKPAYKEKLRVRSYYRASEEDIVFVEIKKKYNSIVGKRRIAVPEHLAEEWLAGKASKPAHSQIANEIEYMRMLYRDLKPACFLTYDREAFYDPDGSDLRITTDRNIMARNTDMSLRFEAGGTEIIPAKLTLLEVKTSGVIPIWLARFLSENDIRKTSFSKYGEYYRKALFPDNFRNANKKGGLLYA